MSDPVFDPAWTLPRRGTFQAIAIDDTITDQGEIGPGRKRARTTRVRLQFSFVQICKTAADLALVERFIFNTVQGPLIPFVFTHPIKNTLHRVRFTDYPATTYDTCNFANLSFSLEEV